MLAFRAGPVLGIICLAASAQTWENDAELVITKLNDDYEFWGHCEAPGGSWSSQPPPPRPTTFHMVRLDGCAPPANVSLSALLSAANVSAVRQLVLLNVPRGAPLSAASFAGMEALELLRLTAADDPAGSALVPAPGVLSPLSSLQHLELERVRVEQLPPRLASLRLDRTGLRALPQQALQATSVELWEPQLTMPEVAPGACLRMRRLTLDDAPSELLERLVGACDQLQQLSVRRLRARTLPRGLLARAQHLLSLSLAHGRLAALPDDLLAYSPKLDTVNFTDLQLESLPSQLFERVNSSLTSLTLSRNRLRARHLHALQDLTELVELHVRDNPLGDLCQGHNDSSALSRMHKLSVLDLSGAQLPRVCGDWLTQLPALRTLNVSRNGVRSLACGQLRVQRARDAALDLRGNPFVRVNCSEADFQLAAPYALEGVLTVRLDSRLACDCGAYWLLRVQRERGVPARFEPRCAATSSSTGVIRQDQPLQHVSLDALACALPDAQCARTCSCEQAPHAGGVRARCRGPDLPVQELQRLLQAHGLELVELRAPHAGLTALSARLPLSLKYLDVGDNGIRRGSSDAAAALFAGGRRVRLAGNPLACQCLNRPLLDVLRAHRHLVEGYENMTCADGRPLEPVTDQLVCDGPEPGRPPAALAGLVLGAVVLALLAGVLAAVLARPETRLRVKALLHARGVRVRWLARRLEPPAAACAYDAFVAHAEDDERFVAEEIVPRLEPRRRLCVSYRDWAVGAWIPAEIEASVSAARRTLCLLSPRALASRWARAQLRTAHAHALGSSTPTLVLILLDVSCAELRADPELRGVLDAHARLRWGERCFWEKLEYMLPDPLPRTAAA